jgi:hypothetical protein
MTKLIHEMKIHESPGEAPSPWDAPPGRARAAQPQLEVPACFELPMARLMLPRSRHPRSRHQDHPTPSPKPDPPRSGHQDPPRSPHTHTPKTDPPRSTRPPRSPTKITPPRSPHTYTPRSRHQDHIPAPSDDQLAIYRCPGHSAGFVAELLPVASLGSIGSTEPFPPAHAISLHLDHVLVSAFVNASGYPGPLRFRHPVLGCCLGCGSLGIGASSVREGVPGPKIDALTEINVKINANEDRPHPKTKINLIPR